MKSVTTNKFRKAFNKLPKNIQAHAILAYHIWKNNNNYPGLDFKKVHTKEKIYSVRVGLSYRALGIIESGTIIWFWIGSHEDYNNLLAKL